MRGELFSYIVIPAVWKTMTRKIVITSGKGGVGKTTICANIGVKLAYLGYKVVMLDADIGLNNLDVVMGMESRVTYDILDVVEGKCRIRQALVQDLYYPSLYILPSSHMSGSAKISAQEFKAVTDKLTDFDFALIDCPAGIDGGFHRAVYGATEAYVVVTPNISSVRDADKVLTILSGYGLRDIGVILNRVRGDLIMRGESVTAGDIARVLRSPIRGVIPESDDIARGVVFRSSDANFPFELLADNLICNRARLYDCTAAYRGIKNKLKRLVRL